MTFNARDMTAALEGRYTIERELGRGGMATVYLAEDLKLHRRVALKVLRPDLAASLGNERFLREIAIAARLTHPHILPLHDSGEAGGHLYYAMPYVEGESLRQRLEREGQLPIAEVIAIVRAVASALTYANQQGIIHRDIKPENILLAKDASGGAAHPLVADFGIARALDVAGGERLTETGLALGTPAYMSPEQSAADGRLDGRSDIYALGCVAYEMLAGAPPFTGPTAQSILARHAVDRVPPLHTVRATIPVAMEEAIEQALAKVPADRFATADEFARALTTKRRALRPRFVARRVKLALGIAAGVAAAGTAALIIPRSSASSVIPSAATMAVLPFFAAPADTALTRLGTDLAVTISSSLNGVGGIKTTDRLTVANATSDRHNLSAAEGATLAKQLGASSYLRGTLVRAGDNVRLDAGLYSTDGLAPLAEGITVTGHRDSIGALTDSVTLALLRQVWQRGEAPSPSLSAVTTKSLPALRAFLEGERELVSGDWDGATLAYRSAMVADSTFWLAYFGYALARYWTDQPVEPSVIQALGRNREGLPERERLLVDGFLVTDRTPRLKIEAYRLVTQRFPQYWPGWFLYADVLFHQGPVAGYEWSEALDAFRRVVALKPKLVPAWEHIGDLATGRDRAEASRALARLYELGYPPPGRPGYGRFVRLVDGIDSAGGVIPASLDGLADTVARFSATSGDEQLAMGSPLALLQRGFPLAQLQMNRRRLALSGLRVPVLAANLAGSAWSWATRGQWDSALVIMDRAAAAYQGRFPWTWNVPVENYALAVLGAWLGTVDPTDADRRRVEAIAAVARTIEEGKGPRTRLRDTRGGLAWLDGLLGFARRDRRAIQAARAEAARSGYFRTDLIDRSLAAFDRALAGDTRGAGRELAKLEEECIGDENCPSMTPHIAVQRIMAAEWLREDGDVEQARRLLRWQDASWLGWPWTFNDAVSGPAFLMRARIEEGLGNKRQAREYYEQFLRRYDRPMPSQAHLVQEARTALARLQQDQ
jgi:tetratricopeptide (TPR) repeat protein/tRNA A-37 threonylcarbamoyl transferase component Bud32/TolB-like protein